MHIQLVGTVTDAYDRCVIQNIVNHVLRSYLYKPCTDELLQQMCSDVNAGIDHIGYAVTCKIDQSVSVTFTINKI